MGGDLFGSYVATVLATIVLGQQTEVRNRHTGWLLSDRTSHAHCSGWYIIFHSRYLFVRISDTAGINTNVVQKR